MGQMYIFINVVLDVFLFNEFENYYRATNISGGNLQNITVPARNM